jgi:hypothetical protein
VDSAGSAAINGVINGAIAWHGFQGSASIGSQDGGGDSIRLTNGNVTGGAYLVTVEGGASALVDGVTAPVPSLATCLGL